MLRWGRLSAAAPGLLAGALSAHALSGPAEVVDGDTLRVAGEVVRLHAIDAPEAEQTCHDSVGRPWGCAAAAERALSRLARGGLSCDTRGRGGYGRVVAVCRTADGVDVGAALVRAGFAFAFADYGADYVADEAAARAEGLGVWQGAAERPSDWRRARRARDGDMDRARTVEGGCRIKGNISANGRIYHLPGQRDYDRTRIDPARGERWFCSVAQAERAGWRAARR